MMNKNKPDIFVYGLSGAGKDTIADHFKAKYHYTKLRVAHTIKSIITEKYNVGFDELEMLKRTDPGIRKEHNDLGDKFGNKYHDTRNASLNRCELLCNGKAMDYQLVDFKNAKVICDVRTVDEMIIFLENGFTGIFLSRRSDEFKVKDHITENYLFNNEEALKMLLKKYGKQIQIIDNHFKPTGFPDFVTEIWRADGPDEVLLRVVDNVIFPNKK